MEPNPQNGWDALTESAKALANLLLGEDQTNLLREHVSSYPQLLAENKQLKAEVASLKETLPFKDKYENLQKQFRKVAAERDSLSSQVLQLNHKSKDYERLKSAYQETKGKLAALENQMEEYKSSIGEYSALEILYQAFKRYCNRFGVKTSQIPTNVFLQFQLQNEKALTLNQAFNRQSRIKWTKLDGPPLF
jgi:chromosome segregation ATPase